jgi:hypothetical protein
MRLPFTGLGSITEGEKSWVKIIRESHPVRAPHEVVWQRWRWNPGIGGVAQATLLAAAEGSAMEMDVCAKRIEATMAPEMLESIFSRREPVSCSKVPLARPLSHSNVKLAEASPKSDFRRDSLSA